MAAFIEAARRGPAASRVDALREAPADPAALPEVPGFGMAATL